jgi:hypothetical protein
MKGLFILLLIIISSASYSQQKSQKKLSPAELKLSGQVCDCLTKIDISAIKGPQEAGKAFEDCITAHADLIMNIAAERKIDITDETAMNALGLDVGKNLLTQNCAAALKLGMKMSDGDNNETRTQEFEGIFKRIEDKGFNYIILTDKAGSEKSFIWLRQFPGSERFTAPAAGLTGKRLKVTWQDVEVYLPSAKGYYNVKEITSIDIL